MNLLIGILALLPFGSFEQRHDEKSLLPCGPGYTNVYMEQYGDPEHPAKVTASGFYCVPVPYTTARSKAKP